MQPSHLKLAIINVVLFCLRLFVFLGSFKLESSALQVLLGHNLQLKSYYPVFTSLLTSIRISTIIMYSLVGHEYISAFLP
ncbi:hypothetical protein B0H14DRAFT_2878443 [Mycena olivaceomarginata]|nr:hypothetical protein B0H14DRAFT_2878443 [Mycena olivaceomarginata]